MELMVVEIIGTVKSQMIWVIPHDATQRRS